jgi:hypothetical protein
MVNRHPDPHIDAVLRQIRDAEISQQPRGGRHDSLYSTSGKEPRVACCTSLGGLSRRYRLYHWMIAARLSNGAEAATACIGEYHVLYVAATRAIDVLKVPACYDDWLGICDIAAITEAAPQPHRQTVAA